MRITDNEHWRWRFLTKNVGMIWFRSSQGLETFHDTLGKRVAKAFTYEGERYLLLHTKRVWLTVELPGRKR